MNNKVTGEDVVFFWLSLGSRRAAADEGARGGRNHRKEAALWLVGSRHRQIRSYD